MLELRNVVLGEESNGREVIEKGIDDDESTQITEKNVLDSHE